jgi:hypothetical protein
MDSKDTFMPNSKLSFWDKVKDFFSVYGARVAIIVAILAIGIYTTVNIVSNIKNANSVYNIVMLGNDYVSVLDKPVLQGNLDKNVKGLGEYTISVFSKEDFHAVSDQIYNEITGSNHKTA